MNAKHNVYKTLSAGTRHLGTVVCKMGWFISKPASIAFLAFRFLFFPKEKEAEIGRMERDTESGKRRRRWRDEGGWRNLDETQGVPGGDVGATRNSIRDAASRFSHGISPCITEGVVFAASQRSYSVFRLPPLSPPSPCPYLPLPLLRPSARKSRIMARKHSLAGSQGAFC